MTKKTLTSEKGASSILVIFMMMVLVTFGALAITSANVNYKLSRRTLEWNTTYYDMDGQGEKFIAALDNKLAEAERLACEYMKDSEYLNAESGAVSPELQSAVFSAYSEGSLTNIEVLNKIYMYYADIFVNELLLDFNDIQVYPYSNESFIDSIYTEASFKPSVPESEIYSLKVSVSIEPLKYEISETGGVEGSLVLLRGAGLRYKIEDWYEYQEPLNEEPAEELWDGEMLDSGGELWDGTF